MARFARASSKDKMESCSFSILVSSDNSGVQYMGLWFFTHS